MLIPYVLSIASFVMMTELAFVIETTWPAKLNVFITWPSKERSSTWSDFIHVPCVLGKNVHYRFFFSFIFISWRLITLQYCSVFCHTLIWISHGFTCVSHNEPPSHPPSPSHPFLHIHSVQFSCSVVSDSLQPHESQHARPPCPSPTPGVYSNSRPLSQWCYPAVSSSVIPFSSCPQSLPASGSFPMSQLFASGGQSTGVSASASVLSMNTQDWSPLGWTGWISLQSKGLSRVFSNTTVQKHQFFGTQLSSQSNSHIHTWPLEKP